MDLVEAAHWQLAGPTRRRFLAVLAHGLTMTARCWKLLFVGKQTRGADPLPGRALVAHQPDQCGDGD
jgi:hypothetical protein